VALKRIAGVVPAFMRPRKLFITYSCRMEILTSTFIPAFGSYNELVRDVAGVRGQTVAIWDFEYVPLHS
jgi:hypothetical protein